MSCHITSIIFLSPSPFLTLSLHFKTFVTLLAFCSIPFLRKLPFFSPSTNKMARPFETVSDINNRKELWVIAVKIHHKWKVTTASKEHFEMVVVDKTVSHESNNIFYVWTDILSFRVYFMLYVGLWWIRTNMFGYVYTIDVLFPLLHSVCDWWITCVNFGFGFISGSWHTCYCSHYIRENIWVGFVC